MGRQIDFNVTGKARGELAKAIGEILNKEVRYMKVPTCNYEIGGSILDRNGVFIPSDELSDSQLDLLLERFVEKYMPSTEIHVSTQANILNYDKQKTAPKLLL